MPTIQIEYNKTYQVFTAVDEMDNQVNFQTIIKEAIPEKQAASSYGVRPMQGLLMSLGTCSGIDIVSILEKQRQQFDRFTMTVTAERAQEVIPALWVKAHVHFNLEGNLENDKVWRAAELSITKYCSVAETLRRAGCMITYSVSVNGNSITV
jgi:putative redox protein